MPRVFHHLVTATSTAVVHTWLFSSQLGTPESIVGLEF